MRAQLALAVIVTVSSSMVSFAWPQPAQSPANETAVLQEFSKRIDEYAALHRRLEGPLPAMVVTDDPRKIYDAQQALAAAIRAARASARDREIFTEEVGAAFRAVIRHALKGCNVAAVYAEMTEDTTALPSRPRVNATYIWGCSGSMPVDVLHALPPLPEDLTYRFVGRDLVIVDIHANLVVDVLPEAFPPS